MLTLASSLRSFRHAVSSNSSLTRSMRQRNWNGGSSRLFRSSAPLSHFKDPHSGESCDFGSLKEDLKKQMDDFVDKESSETVSLLRESMPELEDVLLANKEWVDKMTNEDGDYFVKLGMPQKPRYLYIGCSDARVDPSRLTQQKEGSLFVHRNIGNIVSGTDLNLLSVVDFAVNYLKVPHILVVGHYDCGAVRAALGEAEDGGLGQLVENWIRNVRDVARFHIQELSEINDPEVRVRRLVELNVQEQCLNVFKLGSVQRARLKNYVKNNFALPRVHGLVFDPRNGVLRKLPFKITDVSESEQKLYQLYPPPKDD